jgi:hypothetical protein
MASYPERPPIQIEREPEIVTPTATHLRLKRHCHFSLTEAIRPGESLPLVCEEGYRLERFRDPRSRARLPMLAASVSAEHLFDVFLDLLQPLGESVHAVLETSHDSIDDWHDDLRRSDIDLPVLASHLCEHEDLLLNDGCTGIAVIARGRPVEVQFDEHKLLYVFALDLKPFRRILRFHGIQRVDGMRLIAECEHLHHTTTEYGEEFRHLSHEIGAGDFESVLSDECGEWMGS